MANVDLVLVWLTRATRSRQGFGVLVGGDDLDAGVGEQATEAAKVFTQKLRVPSVLDVNG